MTEVQDCLTRLIDKQSDPQLVILQQGLNTALQTARSEYFPLRQAANWLHQIAKFAHFCGLVVGQSHLNIHQMVLYFFFIFMWIPYRGKSWIALLFYV